MMRKISVFGLGVEALQVAKKTLKRQEQAG